VSGAKSRATRRLGLRSVSLSPRLTAKHHEKGAASRVLPTIVVGNAVSLRLSNVDRPSMSGTRRVGGKKRNRRVIAPRRVMRSIGGTAGMRGFQSVRQRGTDNAARKLMWRRRKVVKDRGRKGKNKKLRMHVRREGRWKGSKAARKTRKRCKVRSVTDRTRQAHNGCHGKKRRRR
jgi:ribosomal protein S11